MQATTELREARTIQRSEHTTVVRPGLTWRDGVATAIGIGAGFVVWATIQDWGWPLLGGPRAGVGALLVFGLATCTIGGSTIADASIRGPFINTAGVLGLAAFAIAIAGLITGSEAMMMALMADIVVLWTIATTRHALRKT